MKLTTVSFEAVDLQITRWLARHGVTCLRLSMGLIFLWFGMLKFFPGLSPAQDLAGRTIGMMTFGVVPAAVALPVLALWEVAIGLGFLVGRGMRATLALLVAQMAGTLTPLFLFPAETFAAAPFVPTLEGQYIIKNVVLVSAGLVLGAVVRGGRLVAEPDSAGTR
jgi:uncharacterized membrane protein YphA (DoxX/SURF4 family)